MQKTIALLKENNLLREIDDELDIYLEIPHIAYVETKKKDSKALLFTRPISKKTNKKFDIPVLMNVFCNELALELLLGNIKELENELKSLIKMQVPKTFRDKLSIFSKLFSLKNVIPKRLKQKGACQELVNLGEDIKLSSMPILTTWEQDGGPFITMGQVYTQSLDGKMQNLGMYRLQVYDDKTLGMHWQIHKDSSHFFHEYKKAGKKMPVSVAIGGEPAYIWCGQAPLPLGVFELLLYGFIKKKPARLVKSLTNEIYIPSDNDFVIEGFVDTSKEKIEGPFGDHTGYYTLKEPYPFMEITAITSKKNPVFLATVVAKPPLEDKYMGYATERIFLPLLQLSTPDLIDYHMPENGVFHNLILAKINTLYPAHAFQLMHAFWGVGQMSFVKHAIFVGVDAPKLDDYENLARYILNRLNLDDVFLSKGILDALDHSSDSFAKGGKIGIDCTSEEELSLEVPARLLSDEVLLKKMQELNKNVKNLKQYFTDTINPICIIATKKVQSQKELFKSISSLFCHTRIVICVDKTKNNLDNLYMLVWRVSNNIDGLRDVYKYTNTLCLDASDKNKLDGFTREWPDDVDCSKSVLEDLKGRGILDFSDEFAKKFYL